MIVYCDIETYSDDKARKLKSVGEYKYAETASITLIAWAVDDGIVQCWDLASDGPPKRFVDAINQMRRIVFHRASFDRTLLKQYLGIDIPWDRVWDSSDCARTAGLPPGLDELCRVLGMPEEQGKLKEGKRLIEKFCKPTHGGRVRNKETDPEDWFQFMHYCCQDVRAMRDAWKLMPKDVYFKEHDLWVLNQKINERGHRVDVDTVVQLMAIIDKHVANLESSVPALTHHEVQRTSQRDKLLAWINEQGVELKDLTKASVAATLQRSDLPVPVRKVLTVRKETSLTSTAKFKKMIQSVCADGRIRGYLQYYGAHTGRWSGRRVQTQNIVRGLGIDPEILLQFVLDGTYDLMLDQYPLMDLMTSCIRPVLTVDKGHKLIASDLSQIEARMLPWLARDEKTLKAFRDGLDIYKVAAAKHYDVHYDDVTKDQRFVGKVAVLSLGYGGGVGAFTKMARNYGAEVSDEEAKETVRAWRRANPKIVTLWSLLENAARLVIASPHERITVIHVSVYMQGKWMVIELPSARRLYYYNARLEETERPGWNGETIVYDGINSQSRKWTRLETYGGSLANDITQGSARDVIAANLLRIERAGYEIINLVHDEDVTEVPDTDEYSADELSRLMTRAPSWCRDLPIEAGGYEAYRYRKD